MLAQIQVLQHVEHAARGADLAHHVVQYADQYNDIAIQGRLPIGGRLHGLSPLTVKDVAPGASVYEVLAAAGGSEGLIPSLGRLLLLPVVDHGATTFNL
ncbi:hypothetical protein [Longibacter sp.]|jgi:hypothetical protein|uniref:hypothetical protein n=1 Tax=Longibacter sp. TaxID=2045415 RepID=UPI003EB76B46